MRNFHILSSKPTISLSFIKHKTVFFSSEEVISGEILLMGVNLSEK